MVFLIVAFSTKYSSRITDNIHVAVIAYKNITKYHQIGIAALSFIIISFPDNTSIIFQLNMTKKSLPSRVLSSDQEVS